MVMMENIDIYPDKCTGLKRGVTTINCKGSRTPSLDVKQWKILYPNVDRVLVGNSARKALKWAIKTWKGLDLNLTRELDRSR